LKIHQRKIIFGICLSLFVLVGTIGLANLLPVIVPPPRASTTEAPDIYSLSFPLASGLFQFGWYSVSGASNYAVYRDTSSITSTSGMTAVLLNTTDLSYSETLPGAGNYYFAVTAYDGLGESAPSVPNIVALFQTTMLNAITLAGATVSLSWNGITGADAYYIFRNNTEEITEVNARYTPPLSYTIGATTYQDSLTEAGTYYYAVIPLMAMNPQAQGFGVLSNCQSVTYAGGGMAAPTFTGPIVPYADGTVNLQWTSVPYATTYELYCGVTPISDVSLMTPVTTTSDLTYSHSLASSGYGTYYYAVTASNLTAESGPSNNAGVLYQLTTLSPILPNPTESATITLQWNDVLGAEYYYVFRDPTAPITMANLFSHSMIAQLTVETFSDTLPSYGTYYYAIIPISYTIMGLGVLSNCESVVYGVSSPILDEITPNPTTSTAINLNWNDVSGATGYYVYRATSTITSVSGMTPIASPTSPTFADTLPDTYGTYYYVVVATDGVDNSSISNCRSVTYTIAAPVLDPITSPTTSPSISLTWDVVTHAIGYYVYRATSMITSVSGMTPIASPITSEYTDTLPATFGTYYYVVVATDGVVTSAISNCRSVTYAIDVPVLEDIVPSLTPSASISLTWDVIDGATVYYMYRAQSEITDVTGMDPIASSGTSSYTDTLGATAFGNYYYVVVASNGIANTSISNCESVNYYDETQLLPPTLNAITPNPCTTGPVNLDWNDIPMALRYHVYRSTSPITDLTGMTPIASPTTSAYVDTISALGTYYYTVVASNTTSNSSISNNQRVTVALAFPVFAAITPNPTTSGSIALSWSSAAGATQYKVYRATSNITSVSGMTALATVTGTSYTDNVSTNGTYYYVVVADGPSGLTAMSNCVSVTYTGETGGTTPTPPGIPGMSPFLLVAIIAVMMGPLVQRMRRKAKR